MDEKRNDGKVWILVDRPVRHRLNVYKALLGMIDGGVLDQSGTITTLLDKAGAPVPPVADAQPEAVPQ
jgi:hypothetical protein